MQSTTVKTNSKAKVVPKFVLSKYLTEQALSSVAGAPSVYAVHTDGTKCDTSKGCKCAS